MTTKNFAKYEFARHVLIAENIYKENYFQNTLNVRTQFILGEKDITTFIRDNFAPGVKYNSQKVNSNLNNFVGVMTKIAYGRFGLCTC